MLVVAAGDGTDDAAEELFGDPAGVFNAPADRILPHSPFNANRSSVTCRQGKPAWARDGSPATRASEPGAWTQMVRGRWGPCAAGTTV